MAENVRVAVRVRPFNERENTRNATLVVSMDGKTTTIRDPENMSSEPKTFNFDFSYWSHDGFTTRPSDGYMEPSGSKYADQRRVFDDLGRGVLDNAWKGYNCSLFAYGQTGSGKTYSMVGYNSNKGIVPMFCDELFSDIEKKRTGSTNKEVYEVQVSMLEIYNEQVRDLLNAKSLKQAGAMKIKSDPKRGFYVDSLITALVSSYPEIENKINQGTKNRTVASTKMNATSSRAHTIVAINFKQVGTDSGGTSMTRTSTINLVDLAGSERVAKTGAEGDRLKEGNSINQSLSTLGNVINALAKDKGGHVPYRDSVLTKLLKNALGGNSKTIMIAALSPADINYKETLSTLRFADRAKAIKTKATVNENPTDKLIRELKEENARLLKLLQEGGISALQGELGGGEGGATSEEKRLLEEQLQQNQKEMDEMKTTWEQRLEIAQKENKEKMDEVKRTEEHKKTTPHFWNLNEDPALTGMVFHFCDKGKVVIGSRTAESGADISLSGLGIQPKHAEIINKDEAVLISPIDSAKVSVNGQKILAETRLHHHDRVLFGANCLYIFHHHLEAEKLASSGQKSVPPTFDQAQQEIAMMAGLVSKDGSSKEDLILQDEVAQLLRIVNEANAMSEEMDKRVKFEVALLAPAFRSLNRGPTEVRMKVKDLTTGNQWLWTKDKAIHRHSLMQQHYQDFISKDEHWQLTKEEDPFWEPADTEVLIGVSQTPLMSLAYKCSVEETADIHDHKTQVKGYLQLEIIPCDKNSQALDVTELVEDSSELVGKDLYFTVKINGARGLPPNIKQVLCKYKLYLDNEYSQTEEVAGTSPDFNFEKLYVQNPVTQQFLNYLKERLLIIEVWGRQKDDSSPSHGKGGLLSTKDLMVREKTFIGRSALEDGGEKRKKKKKKKRNENLDDSTIPNGIVIPVPLLPPVGGQPSSHVSQEQRDNMSTMTKGEEAVLKGELESFRLNKQQLIQESDKVKTENSQLKQKVDTFKAENLQMKQEITGYITKGGELQKENYLNKKSLEDVKELLNTTRASGKSTINVSELARVLGDPADANREEELGSNTSKACVVQ